MQLKYETKIDEEQLQRQELEIKLRKLAENDSFEFRVF